jgi:hypothetical protein
MGYVALFLIPPAVLGVVGVLQALVREDPFGQQVRRLIDWIPRFDVVAIVAIGLGVIWLSSTLLYWAAVRARIPFWSAAVGGLASALALPVVFWAYVAFQIGVTKTSALSSGFLAFPVFLAWSFSSWFALLVGAEVAVAHYVDSVLPHGARAFALDLAGEREASLALLVRLARDPQSGAQPEISGDDLARELRLPPQLVRNLCVRLVERNLLVETSGGFMLRPDRQEATLRSVLDAVERDPALAEAHRAFEQALPPIARPLVADPVGAARGAVTLADIAGSQARPA